MFDIELRNISRIVERVLDKPKGFTNLSGWTEYNCPYCAEYINKDSDGKYNCCVNYEEGYFHCWKCNEAGKISKILKRYGGELVYKEYLSEIKSIRASKDYQFISENKLVRSELGNIGEQLELPENFRTIKEEDPDAQLALDYLRSRGITMDIIKQYQIGYVPWSDDYKMRCRIVVPSYDNYGVLNFYVTRDYTGKQKFKYINSKVDKKDIIFNEGLVNYSDNIYLVEGVFDAFAIPNSIPLLGKVIDQGMPLYEELRTKARANIVIVLDDDAIEDAKKVYKLLNKDKLHNRVRIVIPPKGYDVALIFQKYGRKGIATLLKGARQLNDYELL